jgi:hypothetical protein
VDDVERARVEQKARAKPSESPAAAKSPRANLDNLDSALKFLTSFLPLYHSFFLFLSSTQR